MKSIILNKFSNSELYNLTGYDWNNVENKCWIILKEFNKEDWLHTLASIWYEVIVMQKVYCVRIGFFKGWKCFSFEFRAERLNNKIIEFDITYKTLVKEDVQDFNTVLYGLTIDSEEYKDDLKKFIYDHMHHQEQIKALISSIIY